MTPAATLRHLADLLDELGLIDPTAVISVTPGTHGYLDSVHLYAPPGWPLEQPPAPVRPGSNVMVADHRGVTWTWVVPSATTAPRETSPPVGNPAAGPLVGVPGEGADEGGGAR